MGKLDDEVKTVIPANVFIISGSKKDVENKVDYSVVDKLPKITGKVGGHLTTAWLQVMNHNVTSGKLTWVDMLDRTKQSLENDGYYNQVPQLASSRQFNVKKQVQLFPSGSGRTRALLIGMQYTKKEGELKNSHAQVEAMRQYLARVHKVSDKRIEVLTDQVDQVAPTRRNILIAMEKLARATQPGDSAFVLICGHAGRINGDDETLFPIDFASAGVIQQEDIYKNLICAMPARSNLICLFDMANSGALINLPYIMTNKDKEYSGFYQNVAFEIGGIIGLAVIGTALGVGVTGGDGDDCCLSCWDGCFSGLFD